MGIKYEAVFGDQGLFDGAPECAVIAIKRPFISGVRSEEMYFFSSTFDAVMKAGSSFNFNNVILKTTEYAERRIIPEPKRWTVEDQKAGRLPEVGTKVMQCNEYCTVDILSVHHGYIVACNSEIDDSRPVSFAIEKFIELFNPIETPAEKAARLKSEWCAKAAKQLKNLEYTSTLKSIYDALLSGELKAPEVQK